MKIIFGYIARGFKSLALSSHLVLGYWFICIIILLALIIPAVSLISIYTGSSAVDSVIISSPRLENYFFSDIFNHLLDNYRSVLNPMVIISGFIAILVTGIFFTAGLLARFASISFARKEIRTAEVNIFKGSEFMINGYRNFSVLFFISLFGAGLFFIINIMFSQLYQLLGILIWHLFRSEAVQYYIADLLLRALFYATYFLLAIFLQFARISAVIDQNVFNKDDKFERFKKSLIKSYTFIIKNKARSLIVYGFILLIMLLVFILHHFIFYKLIPPTGGNEQLLLVIIASLLFIFLRFWSYSACTELYIERDFSKK